ncbi:pullulanase [Tateyamaria omphalii]|uniref:photosynthetic complex assembly protein PuhC n=1 Tax=Tateyamaria omphalii TaxID=299262 RepID=UPI001C98ECFC|nr:photosynthetic complex assembly protein PuhC [Tateyamaria omphalii]MBY5935469.1 pullulanase [Tateyamaria omphalii]
MSDAHSPRIHAKEDELVPRVLIRAVLALLLIVLSLVTIATLTDRPLESTPAQTEVIAERAIYLSGDASGAARVMDLNGAILADFPSDKGGFVAGIERVIARERAKARIDATAPVILRLRAGNRLSIYDPETNWSAELMGFGADNLRTFARLLEPPRANTSAPNQTQGGSHHGTTD